MLGTVKKAGQLLGLFDVQHPEWSVTDLATAMKLPKSSAHDHVSSLTDIGLLQRTPEGRYRLGWRLLALSETLRLTTDLQIEGKPVLENFATRVGESFNLNTLANGRVVRVCSAGPGASVLPPEFGMGRPAHCTSAGKVMLAYTAWHEVEEMIENQGGLERHTPNTITDVAELKKELDLVRLNGFSYDFEEIRPGVCCVAAPVRDHTGRVLAAVRLSTATDRFAARKTVYCALVVEASNILSRKLGYLPPKRLSHAVAS